MMPQSANATANQKPEAIVLVGLPGSGKSTWAKAFKKGAYPVLSSDAHIDAYAVQHNITYRQAYAEYYPQAVEAFRADVMNFLKIPRSFIWDQINADPRERAGIYAILHPTHTVTFVCFLVPLEICIDRCRTRSRESGELTSEERLHLLAKQVVFPSKETGEPFDKIVALRHPKWDDGVYGVAE